MIIGSLCGTVLKECGCITETKVLIVKERRRIYEAQILVCRVSCICSVMGKSHGGFSTRTTPEPRIKTSDEP